MNEYMETLKEEIVNNFNIYGADHGLHENSSIILNWKEEGMITYEQYKELRKFNREVYSNLPLDM